MPQDPINPSLAFEGDVPPSMQDGSSLTRPESQKPMALVHILTPEFHGFEPEQFDDIPEEVAARASALELQPSLFRPYVRKDKRKEPEVSSFSYRTPDEGLMSVSLTPEEYDTASESVEKLAQRMLSRVLTQRDAALRKETGSESARARSNEDMRVAKRRAVRAVMEQQASMEKLLETGIMPKIELIEKFIEMTEGRNPNLARGTRESVSKRFEELRTTVFDDMLDAVALQRGWKADMTERAKRIIQKRLYVSGSIKDRVANFNEMLSLAHEYYGYKRALILTKIQEARKYQRDNPEVVADIMAVDEERRLEKEAKQLQFEDSQ